MEDAKQQVVDRLKQANNILVTVRNDPSVDLLSACIGLTLILDKMEKHATAVFSGEVPSAVEFLKPEDTIEQTPDSLRDFIIALDKSKADKLRYKVEDKMVRIFITPYRTSLSQEDLVFSQGDFNIDVVVALGAHEQQELDQAITTHGRILHDAAVISINNTPNGNLGSVNWQDIGASSIAEMIGQLVDGLGKDLLDEQIATALLTGIVAETERFSNDKTTPRTMSLAGQLMAAGANQQLVANQLQEGGSLSEKSGTSTTGEKSNDEHSGSEADTLEIAHKLEEAEETEEKPETKESSEEEPADEKFIKESGREMLPMPEPGHIGDVQGSPLSGNPFTQEYNDETMPSTGNSYLVDKQDTLPNTPEPPIVTQPEPPKSNEPPVSSLPPVSVSADGTLDLGAPLPLPVPTALPEPPAPPPDLASPAATTSQPLPEPPAPPLLSPMPPAPAEEPEEEDQTLKDIEESVKSPHLVSGGNSVDDARTQVLEALKQGPQPLEPVSSLNANPLGEQLHPRDDSTDKISTAPPNIEVDLDGNLKIASAPMPLADPPPNSTPALDMPLPPVVPATPPSAQPPAGPGFSPFDPPPPVPPPMTPPGFLSH